MRPVCCPNEIPGTDNREAVADLITGSFLEPCTWCVIELTSGVISVCLPTFWPLLMHASKTYTKYMPSRFTSKLKSKSMSDAGPARALVTIGGSPNWANGGKNSVEKSVEVYTLTNEVSHTSKLSTSSSRDDNASETSHGDNSKPEFQV